MPNQRLTKDTRVLAAIEATRGADTSITKVYVVPIAAESGIGTSRERIEVAIGMGDGLPSARVLGLKQYGGGLPINLDFSFIGVMLRAMWTGYARTGSGSANWHEYFEDVATYGARPASLQFQTDFLEATAKYRRGRSVFLQSMDFRGDIAGGAQYSIQAIGSGDFQTTDILTVLSLAATNYGLGGSVYFNSQIRYTVGGTEYTLDGVIALSCQLARPVAKEDGIGNDGVAVDMPIGVLNMSGELGLPMRVGGTGPTADLTFLENAENDAIVGLDYILADGPLSTCTKYVRMQIVAANLTPMQPKAAPGSNAQALGLKYNQQWQTARMAAAADMAVAGEYHGPTRGTYVVTAATNDKLGIKVDGGGTQTITLTAGTRTVDQIVTNINATLTGAVADNWHGWLRIKSSTKGSSSSIQIDTGIAATGHALFGFDGTTRTGRANCVSRMFVFNDVASNYAA